MTRSNDGWADLRRQIADAETRIAADDQAWRLQKQRWQSTWSERMATWRDLSLLRKPAAWVATAGLAGWAWRLGRGPAAPSAAEERGLRRRRLRARGLDRTTPPPGWRAPPSVAWVRAIGLAWPLLPQQWRRHVPATVATAVATFGLPLLEWWMARRVVAARRRSAWCDF